MFWFWFISLAFGWLPLKPEGEKTLAKLGFGERTIYISCLEMNSQPMTTRSASRFSPRSETFARRAARILWTSKCSPVAVRGRRGGPVTFWNETLRFGGNT